MAVTTLASGTKTLVYGTFTVTIASPAVVTYNSHGLTAGDKVTFTTSGALPTGLTAGTTYFVISAGLAANTFEVAATDGGAAINTSGSQSGTHTVTAEIFLSNPNAAATYCLNADLNALAASDAVDIRIYKMTVTGGTSRVLYKVTYTGAQDTDDLIKVSVPFSTALTDTNALRCSIKQTAGTARAVPWSVEKFA